MKNAQNHMPKLLTLQQIGRILVRKTWAHFDPNSSALCVEPLSRRALARDAGNTPRIHSLLRTLVFIRVIAMQ